MSCEACKSEKIVNKAGVADDLIRTCSACGHIQGTPVPVAEKAEKPAPKRKAKAKAE